MIDEAKRGSVYFRIVISPDPKQEDASRDLYLPQIAEQTILTLEERLHINVPFMAAEHDDHSGARHMHLLALAKARIETQDLNALRETATQAALLQRQERDLAREAQLRAETNRVRLFSNFSFHDIAAYLQPQAHEWATRSSPFNTRPHRWSRPRRFHGRWGYK